MYFEIFTVKVGNVVNIVIILKNKTKYCKEWYKVLNLYQQHCNREAKLDVEHCWVMKQADVPSRPEGEELGTNPGFF